VEGQQALTDCTLSDALLQTIVNKLCCIRKATPGEVTKLLRGFLSVDQAASKAHRTLHRKNQEKVNMDIAKVRVVKANTAAETVLHRTEEAIQASLDSFGEIRGHIGKKLACLKAQFTGRTGRGCEYKDKEMIPMSYRSPSKPCQLVMKKDDRPQAPCLKELLWLGWAYLTKKMPHAATMPIVTAVVCFLSTQNMGS
jgi:hypothetical protein